MSGTIETPAVIMGTDIIDNTTGLVTPAKIRNLAESSFAIVLSSNSLGAAIPGAATNVASYTAQLADRGCAVASNSSNATPLLVIPQNTFAVNCVVGIFWFGGNQPGFSAGSGTTIHPSAGAGNTIRAQWCFGWVWQYATNLWVTLGDMTP